MNKARKAFIITGIFSCLANAQIETPFCSEHQICPVDTLSIVGDTTDQVQVEFTNHSRGCDFISFLEIRKKFEDIEAWGMETTLDITSCNPEKIRDASAITHYVHELCDLIGMKRFGDTLVVHFGENEVVAGYSMTQLIETSLISGHFANATNTIYINVFSCKLYNPYLVAEFTKKFFNGDQCTMNILLRK